MEGVTSGDQLVCGGGEAVDGGLGEEGAAWTPTGSVDITSTSGIQGFSGERGAEITSICNNGSPI